MIYLGVVAVMALAAGILLDSCFPGAGRGDVDIAMDMLPPWVTIPSAVVLVVLLAAALFHKIGKKQ